MKQKISGRQATYLSLGVMMGTIFLPIAQAVAKTGGRDGWMAIIPAFAIQVPFTYLALYIYLKLPGPDFLTGIKSLLGPLLGYPLLILYFLTSIIFAGLLLRQGAELFTRSMMVETPQYIFLAGEALLLVFIVYCGLEVFSRMCEVMVLPIFLSLVSLIIFSIPRAEIGHLKPYLYNGIGPVFKSLTVMSWAFEYTFFLFVLLPYVNKPHELKKSSLRVTAVVSLLLTALVITEFCVMGPEESARMFYGSMALARMATIGTTIYGLEPFFVVFWFGSNIIKLAAFFFSAFASLQAILPLRHKFLNISLLGLVILAMSFVPKSSLQLIKLIDITDHYLILPFAIAGPLLLALVVYVKKKAKR